jgi:hypothetical protein
MSQLEWTLVAFFIGFVTPLLLHYLGTGIKSLIIAARRPQTYYSWYGRLRGKYSRHLMIMAIVWAGAIGIVTPFIAAGTTSPDDPIRMLFGLAGAAGAITSGYVLMLIPRKYSITSKGIHVSGITAQIIPWSNIIHYQIQKNDRVLIVERTMGRFGGTDYIPLGVEPDKIEKALSDARAGT